MIFGRSKAGSPRKSSLRSAPTVLLEKDGKVLFEFSSSSFEKPIVIGRGAECDWSVAGVDPSMSGRHAELFVKHGALRIRDLASRNGLYFHGERIQERRLRPGDEILIGACSLSVERAKSVSVNDKAPRHHRLEQLNGPDAGRNVNLVGPGDVVIGSDASCAIICADTLVSHRHAVISFKPDGSCWVSDLGSRNGSAVNGVPLKKERMLRDGDVLKVAYLEFRFYDKNVVHAHAQVGRTVAIAGATLALVLTGYFIWSSATPSAKTYVAQAQAAAAREDFAEAFALLDKAAVSKYRDIYKRIIREQRERTTIWTNAIADWEAVKKNLAEKSWTAANDLFVSLTPWESAFGWNTGSAIRARREAVCAKRLLDGFLSGRQLLQKGKWDAELPGEFREYARSLAATVSAAEGVVSTNGYCGPLYAAAVDILDELRKTVDDFDAITAALSGLNGKEPGLGRHSAGEVYATLGELQKANARRREDRERQKNQAKPRLRYLRFSTVPGDRLKEICAAVDAFCSSELELDENMEKIAREEYDGVTRELPLPSDESCGQFGLSDYRERLGKLNGQICGTVLAGLRTQMEMLEDHGFDISTGVASNALARLAAPDCVGGMLQFVPRGTKPLDSQAPVCRYDEVVGVVAFETFLKDLSRLKGVAHDASRPQAIPQDKVASCISRYFSGARSRKWSPLLCQVREEYETLVSFEASVANGLPRDIRNLRLPDGGNRIARAADFVRRQRVAFEDWIEDFRDACDTEGSKRAKVLGLGVDLLLTDPENPSVRDAEMLRREYAELKAAVPEEDGTPRSWQAILSADIPGRGSFSAAWRNLYEDVWQREGGGK